MSHRARRVAGWSVVLVLIGFALNLTMQRKGDVNREAATATSDSGPRAVAPIYAPRALSVAYGKLLTPRSSAVDVARAFTVAYLSYDTATQQESDFLQSLPRVSPSFAEALRDTVHTRWTEEARSRTASAVAEPDQLRVQLTQADTTRTVASVTATRSLTFGDTASGQQTENLTIVLTSVTGEWQVTDLSAGRSG